MHKFVRWYNHEHKHSGLKFVTPTQRHSGQSAAIMEHREIVYQEARSRTGKTRNWAQQEEVWLNPERVQPDE